MEKNIRYNPFKMAGSWIGLTIGFIFALLVRSYGVILGLPRMFQCNSQITGGCWTSTILSNMIYIPIICFLIGWGIHVLWRKHKKEAEQTGISDKEKSLL